MIGRSAEFYIDKQITTITVPFDIKQFTVKSVNQYAIYVNTVGGLPSATRYEFSIQANSDFASPMINTRTLYVYTSATNFANVSKITVYEDKQSEAINNSYLTLSQNLNNISYPATVTTSLVFTGYSYYTATLPSIIFENLRPIYFLVETQGIPIMLVESLVNPMGGAFSDVNDAVIKYVPRKLNQSISFGIVSPVSQQVTVQTVYYDGSLQRDSVGRGLTNINSIGSQIVSFTKYGLVNPPAFLFSMYVTSRPLTAVTYAFTLTLTLIDPLGYTEVDIFKQNFSGTLNNVPQTSYLLENFSYTISEGRFLKVKIDNTAINAGYAIGFNLWNYFDKS